MFSNKDKLQTKLIDDIHLLYFTAECAKLVHILFKNESRVLQAGHGRFGQVATDGSDKALFEVVNDAVILVVPVHVFHPPVRHVGLTDYWRQYFPENYLLKNYNF